jgi:hypothetical protein
MKYKGNKKPEVQQRLPMEKLIRMSPEEIDLQLQSMSLIELRSFVGILAKIVVEQLKN